MEKIQNYQPPSSEFALPSIPEGAVPIFNISLSEGVKFKVSSCIWEVLKKKKKTDLKISIYVHFSRKHGEKNGSSLNENVDINPWTFYCKYTKSREFFF